MLDAIGYIAGLDDYLKNDKPEVAGDSDDYSIIRPTM